MLTVNKKRYLGSILLALLLLTTVEVVPVQSVMLADTAFWSGVLIALVATTLRLSERHGWKVSMCIISCSIVYPLIGVLVVLTSVLDD